jgi:hypothetical protein
VETSKSTPLDPALEPIPSDARDVHIELASRIADLQRQRQKKRRQRLAAETGRYARLGFARRLLSMARLLFS